MSTLVDGVDYHYDHYDVEDLLEEKPDNSLFLTHMFFSEEKTSNSKFIEFELVLGGQPLAPFVAPYSNGVVMKEQGSSDHVFAPAYVKPVGVLTPDDLDDAVPGEDRRNPLSDQERLDAKVAAKVANHIDMIDLRLEWMAASALTTGKVVVKGEKYPTKVVDFLHDDKLKRKLTGAKKWSVDTSSPSSDISDMALAVNKLSKGAVVDTIVMDTASYNLFKKNEEVLKELDTKIANSSRSPMDLGPANQIGANYMGKYANKFDVWTYDSYYDDEEGQQQPFLPEGTVLLVSRQSLMGKQHFGKIKDFKKMNAAKYFHKTVFTDEPSSLQVITQSAPMIVPKRVNAYAMITGVV